MRHILQARSAGFLSAALIGASLVFTPSLLRADDIGATGIVKERRDQMEVNKNAAGILFAMVSGRSDFDADVVKKQARAVAGTGGEAMTSLFPEDSLIEPTEALPTIWENWDEFSSLADELVTRAGALESAADDGAEAAQAAFQALGDTCNSCHTKFRIPE